MSFMQEGPGLLVGAALGAAASCSVAALGYFNKDRELDIEMVRISIGIMAGQTGKKDESAIPARKFALRALMKYSGISMSTKEFNQWVQIGTVPPTALQRSSGFNGITATEIFNACVEQRKRVRKGTEFPPCSDILDD